MILKKVTSIRSVTGDVRLIIGPNSASLQIAVHSQIKTTGLLDGSLNFVSLVLDTGLNQFGNYTWSIRPPWHTDCDAV